MSQYKQLTETQGYQIDALIEAGHQQKDIATIIGVSAPTICRELKRNTSVQGYHPKQVGKAKNSVRSCLLPDGEIWHPCLDR